MKHECDIILLSYESPELLKRCVESVLEHTRVPSRLIIVDNASKDPKVAAYLNALHGNGMVTVEKVFSGENEGFAAGTNKGLKLADASFVCLLNNDCVVTEGWLEELIAVAGSDSGIGLVNPQSNTFGSRPDAGASVDDHAELISDRKGRFVELGHAIGFACLIKAEVLEKVGLLDESYVGVCYEDTDLAARARKAGFISVMAEGAYVFHEEQASRKDLKGREEIYRKNREIFEGRWGRLLRVLSITDDTDPLTIAADHDVLKELARERTIVEMWAPAGAEDVKTVRHADVGLRTFTGMPVHKFLWRVLTKKKRFDAVIMKDGFLMRALRVTAPARGTEVFMREEGTRIVSAEGVIFDLGMPAEIAKYLREKGGGR